MLYALTISFNCLSKADGHKLDHKNIKLALRSRFGTKAGHVHIWSIICSSRCGVVQCTMLEVGKQVLSAYITQGAFKSRGCFLSGNVAQSKRTQ